ncbi:ras association domain-containing protein 3 isoform X2 [Phoca vitulina]|uniref:ras association domain-containing protein 3 isoform X2 n=1 Tax=Phoca vitulina TaxID=9720 RepID=UPI001396033D|nr:ras association domain-containing protein 3 isoform X2 [Phoca vitulina]
MGWALRNTKRDRPRFLPSGGPGLSSVGFPSPGKPVPTMLRCLPAGLELRGRTVIASWAGRHIHCGRRCWDRACVRACVCACACVCLAHRRHTQLCLPPAEPAFGLLVYACKLSDREHPLYLRLVAGPRTDTLSFVLREHEIGEWEAFSLPELQNFLRILDKEEDEQLQSLRRRYAAYRQKLEEALSEVWKPG